MLIIPLDERQKNHRERVNCGRYQLVFKTGDLVMAHVVVQSDTDNNIISKSSNQARRPFIVLENTNRSSYIFKKLDDPSVSKKKFITEELYIFPPCILPCDPIDSFDLWFVNSASLPLFIR